MTMFPALNITDVARVQLAARTLPQLEREAQQIFNAICAARRELGEHFEMQGAVTDSHKTLFRISLSRGASRSRIYGYRRDIEDFFPKGSDQ